MKIKTFEEFISEGLWNKGLNRTKNNEVRKEEGKKVKTSIGTEIFIRNTDCDYEQLIKDILDSPSDEFGPDFEYIGNINKKETKQKIINGEFEDAFMIDKYLYVEFTSYEDMVDNDYLDPDEFSEKDYNSIINGIAEAFKNKEFERKKDNSYSSKYVFLLINESDISYYESELSEDVLEYYYDDFKEYFSDNFPDIELEYWSYNNYATNIGMEINYDNLLKYDEVKEWVVSFFKNAKETYINNEDEEE